MSTRVAGVVLVTLMERNQTRTSPGARSIMSSSRFQSCTSVRSSMPPLRGSMASSSTPSRNTRTREPSPLYEAAWIPASHPLRYVVTPGTRSSRSARFVAPVARMESRRNTSRLVISSSRGISNRAIGDLIVSPAFTRAILSATCRARTRASESPAARPESDGGVAAGRSCPRTSPETTVTLTRSATRPRNARNRITPERGRERIPRRCQRVYRSAPSGSSQDPPANTRCPPHRGARTGNRRQTPGETAPR